MQKNSWLFFIAIEPENAKRILRVFEDFGFGDLGLTEKDFLQEDFVIEVGREPRKIQILTGIDGVTFSECYESRLEIDYEGLRLKLIGKSDLIRNKRASGRPKDIIDLQELLRIEDHTEPGSGPNS
jgi:predicted nucleotidyltransferase